MHRRSPEPEHPESLDGHAGEDFLRGGRLAIVERCEQFILRLLADLKKLAVVEMARDSSTACTPRR